MRHFETKRSLSMANALYTSAGIYGGAKFNHEFKAPLSGYLVPLKTLKVYDNLSAVNAHELSQLIDEDIHLEHPDVYFGSRKEEDGSIRFDVTVCKRSKEAALAMARTYKQEYVWDVDKKEAIPCE